jgi:diguanylate cyclase (GGDEF)-like protein
VRYGGEEFVLLFPNMDRMKACQQAERLLQSFHEAKIPQAPGAEVDYLSLSIGVATVVPGEVMLDPYELICAADDALYEAKHAGRNGWRYAAGISGEKVG